VPPPYERFEAWKLAHELALEVYRISDRWPATERYQLTSQVRRAALSVPTNIAEGAAKKGVREFGRYLDIARGSLSELSYLLRFSKDRGVLDLETFHALDELRNRCGRVMWGLYASFRPAKSR
jgi:four helix bundle protein